MRIGKEKGIQSATGGREQKITNSTVTNKAIIWKPEQCLLLKFATHRIGGDNAQHV